MRLCSKFLTSTLHSIPAIYLERGGAIDGQGLLKRFSQEELMKHAIWLREVHSSGAWVDQYEREKGRSIKDITVIYDLKGLSIRHYNPSVLAWFQSHMAMTEDNYPGPIKRIIIIRAPSIFRMVWSVVKHFFPKCSRDKMVFSGSNDHMKVLGKYMNVSHLPRCINPNGQGGPAIGMPDNCFEAGKIPDSVGKGGKNYTPTNTWVNPHLKPVQQAPSIAKRRSSAGGSNSTASTASDISDCEWECSASNAGDWEEVIFSEELDDESTRSTRSRVHVLWEDKQGVEISQTFCDANRSIVFI